MALVSSAGERAAALAAAETRLGLVFPESFRAFALRFSGEQTPAPGEWLPLDTLQTAPHFDLAEFEVFSGLGAEELEKIVPVYCDLVSGDYLAFDFRDNGAQPRLLQIWHDEDELHEWASFSAFLDERDVDLLPESFFG
jgi:hypothetical protein